MGRIHFEVDSELNPDYLKTGYPIDYYGLYHVVKYEDDKKIEVIKTFKRGYGRSEAYTLASELQEAQKQHIEKSLILTKSL